MSHTRRTARRLLAGIGLAGLLAISLVTTAFATETTITVTIVGGPRTVTIDPDFITSNVTSAPEPQSINGSATVTVDDLSGTGDGWHVTLQATDLFYRGPDSGEPIPPENLAVTLIGAPVMMAGQPVDAFGGPQAPDAGAIGSLDQPRTVLAANPDFGQGSYSQTLDLSVTIPAMSKAGSYSGALIVSIAAGP